MRMREISSVELRNSQSTILNSVSGGKTHFIVTRHGEEEAAIISASEYRALRAALEELEDELDVAAAKKAIKEARRKRRKSLDAVAAEMGIDV